MKAQCICLVAFFISSSLPARQPAIAIKVIGGANKHISYLKPVVGRYFPNLPTEDTLNANGELVLPNTETVYIALDKPSDKPKWINMIKFYNLEGYHVMASGKLTDDIYKVSMKKMVINGLIQVQKIL